MKEYSKKDYKKGLENLTSHDNRLAKVILHPNEADIKDKSYALGIASSILKKAHQLEEDELYLENPILDVINAVTIYKKLEGNLRNSIKKRVNKILVKYPVEAEKFKKELNYLGIDMTKKNLDTKINYNYLIPIVLLLGCLFFLTPSFTGNVIFNLETLNANFISTVLFVLGVLSFIYIKRVYMKNSSKKK